MIAGNGGFAWFGPCYDCRTRSCSRMFKVGGNFSHIDFDDLFCFIRDELDGKEPCEEVRLR